MWFIWIKFHINKCSNGSWSVMTQVYNGLTLDDIKIDIAFHEKPNVSVDWPGRWPPSQQMHIHVSQDVNGFPWPVNKLLSQLSLVCAHMWQPNDRKIYKHSSWERKGREYFHPHRENSYSEKAPKATHSHAGINWQSPVLNKQ